MKRILGILSGGSGTRLWPLSRENFPKQYHDLTGSGQPLILDTLDRLAGLGNPVIVTGVHLKAPTHAALQRANREAHVLIEPVGRNTAAAIALLTLHALKEDPDALVGSFHADHAIEDTAAFRTAVEEGLNIAAEHQTVVLIGIRPTHPSTAYGYIQLKEGVTAHKPVERFIEKPNLARAKELLTHPHTVWNAGMFLFPARVMAELFQKHLPEIWEPLSRAFEEGTLEEVYPTLPNVSIDVGIFEKCEGLLCLPSNVSWADLGSWEDIMERRGNTDTVVQTNGTGNAYFHMHPMKKPAVFVGVDDTMVVDTPDALLVLKKGSGQSMREAVNQLKDLHAPQLLEHTFEERPWGRFEILLDTDHFKSKRLLLLPGKKLSYQRHTHRTENWTITSGTGTVRINDEDFPVKPGDHITIPVGTKHRLGNNGTEPLEWIEVQTGNYFGEDDIERFEDDFGRT